MMDLKARITGEILLAYRPIVTRIVDIFYSKLPPSIERQELIQWGMIGLLDALKKWDPGKENQFKTYAEFRIRGGILDELRRLDWVPRSVRDKMKDLARVKLRLESELGRTPSDEEIAHRIGKNLDELFELQGRTKEYGFDRIDEVEIEDQNAVSPIAALSRRLRRDFVAGEITSLPERMQTLLALRYEDDMSLKEIGKILRVTESRVSQLHTKALELLRQKMNGRLELEIED